MSVIWTYLETPKDREDSSLMQLCLETMKLNKGSHDLELVTKNNVEEYLPNLKTRLIEKLEIPARADVIRVQLLKEYGGLWLDADIILFKEPSNISSKLKKFDFVVMGEARPDNWLLGSVKEGSIVVEWAQKQEKLLKAKSPRFFRGNYFALGRELMRPIIHVHHSDCYAFPAECMGKDAKLTLEKLLSRELPEKACIEKRTIAHLRNTAPGFPTWLRRQTKKEILESNTLMGNMFRQALGMEPLEQESKGLGDTIAKVTKAVGIPPCGGCKGRQEKLNRLVPYDKGAKKKP